jgi:hypothetical protein
MRIASLAIIGALGVWAHADAGDRGELTAIFGGDAAFHGFAWQGQKLLEGRVTDPSGGALAGAQVHVVSNGEPERVVSTDRDGHYRVVLAQGTSGLVFVYGDLRITSTGTSSTASDDGETIEMYELRRPAIAPKLRQRQRRPDYSDAAVDHNAWLRAWLLLDVDASGVVTAVKLVDHPGFDLDAIAIRMAFALQLDPARDGANRPVETHMLWALDWPAFWWLSDNVDVPFPETVSTLPCHAGRGQPAAEERSCAPATIANVVSAAWIARPKATHR